MEFRAALANEYMADTDLFAAESFDATHLRIGIATVSRGALTFFYVPWIDLFKNEFVVGCH